MFCIKCGTKLPKEAKFCFSCGSKISEKYIDENVAATRNYINMVPAKCTSCGSNLEVNPNQKTAVCQYCNTSYLVDEAINNYVIHSKGDIRIDNAKINVNGVNVQNLLLRARDFINKKDYESALDYYNRVLDIDFSIKEAHYGVENAKMLIDSHVYCQSNATIGFSRGVLQLREDRIVFVSGSNERVFYLDNISRFTTSWLSLEFIYEDRRKYSIRVGFDSKAWGQYIIAASMGRYPKRI